MTTANNTATAAERNDAENVFNPYVLEQLEDLELAQLFVRTAQDADRLRSQGIIKPGNNDDLTSIRNCIAEMQSRAKERTLEDPLATVFRATKCEPPVNKNTNDDTIINVCIATRHLEA